MLQTAKWQKWRYTTLIDELYCFCYLQQRNALLTHTKSLKYHTDKVNIVYQTNATNIVKLVLGFNAHWQLS